MKAWSSRSASRRRVLRAEREIPERFGSRLEEVRYPFPVEVFGFESQRETLEMAYMDVAPEKPNGRIVLLLHGKNFNGYYWESTVRVLTAAGYRVVVPDQIGFGKSSKPRHYQFSFQQLAINTCALLDQPWNRECECRRSFHGRHARHAFRAHVSRSG